MEKNYISLRRKFALRYLWVLLFSTLSSFAAVAFLASIIIRFVDFENSDAGVVKGARLISGIGLSLSLVLGALLMGLMIGHILKPIEQLTKATAKVAKGDFDVELAGAESDEIGMLTSNFNIMVKELKKIEILRTNFINNISHEFKTPITSIAGFAQMLQDDSLPANKRNEYVGIILEEAARLNSLTSNILKLSQLDNLQLAVNNTEYALDEQLRKMILALQNKWSEKSIKFDLDLEKVSICADENLFAQVWTNLLDNAVKFSHANSTISVTLAAVTQASGDVEAHVRITDNGVGIEEELLPRIFEQFFQADTSHSQSGNGLGLSIVKKITEITHSSVNVESEPGRGTTFEVVIPINKENDGERNESMVPLRLGAG